MADLVTIVGDGQMGLVLAAMLAEKGIAVRLWGRDETRVRDLAATRRSPRRLPGFALPEAVEISPDDGAVFESATLLVNAVPTQFIRPMWSRLREHVPAGLPVVSVSKGIEIGTLQRPVEVIVDALGEDPSGGGRTKCALSGPTIAAELAKHMPATMVAASADADLAHRVQELFTAPYLRIYRLDDVVGVEVAGAAKNVIALAAGIIDGLGVGYNAKSALLARGLAEIARLGAAMGAKVDTFFGVAGVGDLAVTCFSPEGRNRTCGERLGRGELLDSILGSMAFVVEGVATTRSLLELARSRGVEMPITAAVHDILFAGLSPRDAVSALMQREPKKEVVG